MFGFKFSKAPDKVTVSTLKEELRKSTQEREAARLGLAAAIQKLLRQMEDFPLDKKVEMVANDLSAPRRDRDENS